MEFYCCKCKKKVEVDDKSTKKATTKNGRSMRKAECPKCGTTVCKITKKGE